MKVTDAGAKSSQLHREGSMQKERAEHEGYAGAQYSVRITENNNTNADESEKGLLEQITIDKLQRKLRNRRIPNCTYGGVEGRLL